MRALRSILSLAAVAALVAGGTVLFRRWPSSNDQAATTAPVASPAPAPSAARRITEEDAIRIAVAHQQDRDAYYTWGSGRNGAKLGVSAARPWLAGNEKFAHQPCWLVSLEARPKPHSEWPPAKSGRRKAVASLLLTTLEVTLDGTVIAGPDVVEAW